MICCSRISAEQSWKLGRGREASRVECTGWVCLEPDPALANEIRQRCAANQLPLDVNVVVGTEADLPQAQVFDTILYLDVLEHISDDEAEVRRAARRLAIGGRLIILS